MFDVRDILIGLILGTFIFGISGCNKGKYDVVVLQSKVRQLESKLEELKDLPASGSSPATDARITELETKVNELKREISSLRSETQRSQEIFGGLNRANVEAAISSLEDQGADITVTEGEVTGISMTEFPVEQEAFDQLVHFTGLQELAVSGP